MRLAGRPVLRAALAVILAGQALAVDILETVGFSSCTSGNASVTVQRVDIRYNNDNKTVTFDVAGTSNKIQNVTAVLNVTAYGQDIYSRSFDPCDPSTFVKQLCPVPAGTFSARGTQKIPDEYANLVPAIAFQIPDIAAMATLQLQSRDSGENVACIQSQVTNGKTASVPAVSYVAAGVAGAALVLGGVSAVSAALAGGSAALGAGGGSAAVGGVGTTAGGGAGAGTGPAPSPSFTEVFGWFQTMAMNGMLSVNYPSVYRSFAKNFGFSTGLVPWTQLQVGIDNFRASTGGNLTENSVEYLRNATLVFPDGSSQAAGFGQGLFRRAAVPLARLAARQIETSIDISESGTLDGVEGQQESPVGTVLVAVSGIQAYVEQLSIPSGNTFMTVLLVIAIVIAAIVVGILLVKVLLEFWALFGSFPKSLAGFRKHYWQSIARAITSLILLLYGIWVLYCVFQFTRGDSWAAKILAGVTLFVFTAVLGYFSYKIWSTARRLKKLEGDIGGLYDDKSIWIKYSLFYESYRRNYWWVFVPTILYMFAKGVIIAAADGHGMIQASAQLVVEGVMLILLLWSRPYERRSSNVINISIQVVRVLSVVCILVFVEEFGIAQTTQTVTGVVLIAVQSALTGILAILIAWNAIIACCKENPHRKRRKMMEKMRSQRDTLTPLDAHNSLLVVRTKTAGSDLSSSLSIAKTGTAAFETEKRPGQYGTGDFKTNPDRLSNPVFAQRVQAPANNGGGFRSLTGNAGMQGANNNVSRENLLMGAAPPAGAPGANDLDMRQPTIPNIDLEGGYGAPLPAPRRGPGGYDGGWYGPQGGGGRYGGGGMGGYGDYTRGYERY
ncbi:hypothetical protein VTJ83DRAFT_548 [Remersonia thermophila]|uniref:ML-like domain-containing protein n=1 Tax=Remersonia thermophila TaxID=72144 RepID=A0ABR4DLF9_9PEZI